MTLSRFSRFRSRASATALLFLSVTGCAADARDEFDALRTIPDHAPQRIASICENADASGCTLGPLLSALPRADGRTIVSHFGGTLFRFDSAGQFEDSLGRSGRGPGEFESVMHFGEGPADSIGIVDVRGLRVAWIPPRGVGGRNELIPFEMSMQDLRVSRHGTFMLSVPGTDTVGARVSAYVTWFRNDSTRRHANLPAISYRVANSDMSRIPPFLAPRSHWCVTPTGRMAFANGDEWAIRVVDTTYSAQNLELPSMPLDRIELADLQRIARQQGRNEARQDSLAQRQFDSLPDRAHPTVTGLACDDSRIVLVTSGNVSRGVNRWRVIDWSGLELARLRMPLDARLSTVGHGKVTVLRSDEESGAEWVEIYALPSTGM